MNKQIASILMIFFLISCGQADKKSSYQADTTIDSDSTIQSIAVYSPKTDKVIPPEPSKQIINQEVPLNSEFKDANFFGLKEILTEDFNGDGMLDRAQFLTENDKSGIIITDGQTHEKFKIGLGHEFEEMGDDFSWVDYWGIVRDSTSYEILFDDAEEILGDTIVRLEHPSIVIRADELGGGLITFINGKYEWIHQAD